MHITDFHPDPHYKGGATFESGCHNRPNKGKMDVEDAFDELDELKGGKGKGKSRKKDELSGPWGSGVS
jgi:endopolyphosphatase